MTEHVIHSTNHGQVKFADLVDLGAHGRNGYAHQSGISVWAGYGDVVRVYPINSRGEDLQGHLSVPREAIPALIKELQRHA